VRLRRKLVEILDEPPHLVGSGIEERGDRTDQRFAREGSIIWNETRVLAQMSAPCLAEIGIEERRKQRGRKFVEERALK